MHLKLSKSGHISDWEIRIISGVSFMISTILMLLLIYSWDYTLFWSYSTTSYILSSTIIGGCFGPGIFRAASKEKYLIKFLIFVFLILICETILITFMTTILFIFYNADIYDAPFHMGIASIILFFGAKQKLTQIIITVAILFLGFRYIRARESRE